MQIATASAVTAEIGPLTQTVLRWSALVESCASGKGPAGIDWSPAAQLVNTAAFKRVGAYMEEMDWRSYLAFLTEWAGTTRFEATLLHVTEVGDAVFQEIEERHWHGEDFIRKNVIAVYRFDAAGLIRHLDIYEQARDSGRWIVEAATRS